MIKKLTPRNLTARAAYRAAGNPANTRPDSAVGNCFPGLELDVRDLDRRFFPGLVFNAVRVPLNPAPDAPAYTQGLHLVFVDYMYDPMLPGDSPQSWVQSLLQAYRGAVGKALGQGRWYLDWVEQDGKRIVMHDADRVPYDGLLAWRFIRSLTPDSPVSIGLVQRDAGAGDPQPAVRLSGLRRRYRTGAGVFDASYHPGELTQSLCNPWTHDFRDCGCHYWPSNHPDVVMAEVAPGAALPDGQSRDPQPAATYLDWLRNDHGPAGAAAALNTMAQNRPFQVDHYQINHTWERLPFVLAGREIGDTERQPRAARAAPYDSTEAMIHDLQTRLAPMEMTLALQYLYAYFSVRSAAEVRPDRWATLPDDVIFARRFMVGVAIGEMDHARWANQLLWELTGDDYAPVLQPAETIEYGAERVKQHPRALRPLTPEALDSFIAVERPGGALDRAYARCVATLEQQQLYPRHLYELAIRIDTDGDIHYDRLRYLRQVLNRYPRDADGGYPYLRPLEPGSPSQTSDALASYRRITEHLGTAYRAEAGGDYAVAQANIDAARSEMDQLRNTAEALAQNGIGIPFWSAPQP